MESICASGIRLEASTGTFSKGIEPSRQISKWSVFVTSQSPVRKTRERVAS